MITLTEDGTPVGTIDFLNFDPLNNRAELGLLIAGEWRGKGLARQALELLTSYARDHIGLRQLYVFIAVDNTVCLDLFESYGYRRAGVLQSWVKRGKAYRDVALLQMIL
jgi:diamine N-acetyltransferase